MKYEDSNEHSKRTQMKMNALKRN